MADHINRLGRAMEAIEADMIALWGRYNLGSVPSPDKIRDMIAALSTDDFVRMLNAKLAAQPENDSQPLGSTAIDAAAPFTYQG